MRTLGSMWVLGNLSTFGLALNILGHAAILLLRLPRRRPTPQERAMMQAEAALNDRLGSAAASLQSLKVANIDVADAAHSPASPGVRALPGRKGGGRVDDYFGGGGTPAATPRRSLFASDADAKEPAARPWFATSTAPQNVPPPKQKSTTQTVLEAVGLAAPEPEPEPKSRVRAVLESTGLVSPAPEPKEESASYF